MKITEGNTNYYLMKKCLNCFHICELRLKKCPHCNYFFIGEATEEEKREANKKLIDLQNKAKENKKTGGGVNETR